MPANYVEGFDFRCRSGLCLKTITSSLAVDPPGDDEFSTESADTELACRRSYSPIASAGILNSLWPRRKARSSPLWIRFLTWLAEHPQYSATCSGVMGRFIDPPLFGLACPPSEVLNWAFVDLRRPEMLLDNAKREHADSRISTTARQPSC